MAPLMTGSVTKNLNENSKIGLARVPTPKISQFKDSLILKGDEYKKSLPRCYKLRRYYLP
jgi:hypothetical protein